MIRAHPLLLLLPAVVLAWQITPRPLEDRVREAAAIVVARVETIESRAPSVIMGVGDIWRVRLRVSERIKGQISTTPIVTFADAGVQDFPTFGPQQDRLWLLTSTPVAGEFNAPSTFESILTMSELARVRELLSYPTSRPFRDGTFLLQPVGDHGGERE